MSNFWVMKTYKEWAKVFVNNNEIGLDEDGVNNKYTSYNIQQLPSVLDNPRLLRRFDQFCKWAKIGDYVIVGVGQTTQFNMHIIGRIIGEYEFDNQHSQLRPYRHLRKIEIMKVFEEPIQVEKWGQVQRIELVDANDYIDTLAKSM
ncbi:hypothetical protein [Fictibacillus halophilus]|uniref:hypothetical protein n=1 Tax=Fictibacillus halophilus TaxID=1610490 RepID=UPI001CF9B2B7|nr:hypothetical protein [Fictibacillus halophilus]